MLSETGGQRRKDERAREAAAGGVRGVRAPHRLAAVRLPQQQTLRQKQRGALHGLLPAQQTTTAGTHQLGLDARFCLATHT